VIFDRVTVVKSDSGDYDLVLSNVSVSSAGQYVCVEDMGLGAQHIIELNVTGMRFTYMIY